MSLILEALRKSEAERRLGQAPDVLAPMPAASVPGASTRRHGALWVGLASISLAALAVVAWWATRTPTPQVVYLPAPAAPATTAAVVSQIRAASPADATEHAQGDPASTATTAAATNHDAAAADANEPSSVHAEPARVASAFASVRGEPPSTAGVSASVRGEPASVVSASASVRGEPARSRTQILPRTRSGVESGRVEDSVRGEPARSRTQFESGRVEPRAQAARNPTAAALQSATRQAATLPAIADAPPVPRLTPRPPPAAITSDEPAVPPIAILSASERAALPPLKITLHSWSADPARRFMIVDGQRVGEGARLAGGVVLVHIRRDGAELDVNGRRLLLPNP
ncbi:MAG: general secretion pathway protein GspB [Proteobacteria bacterium]|nr:general secretion pathway protein GspB [Pseudomonadota bacterium]